MQFQEEAEAEKRRLSEKVNTATKEVKAEARGWWNWLRDWFFGTRDSIATQLKNEEFVTKVRVFFVCLFVC